MKTFTWRQGPHVVRYLAGTRAILWAGPEPAVGVFSDLIPENPGPVGLLIVHAPEGRRYELPLGEVRKFPVIDHGFGTQHRIPFSAMRQVSGPPLERKRPGRRRKRPQVQGVLPFGGAK